MLNQRDLELDMVAIGKEHADRVYAEAEEKGRASSNPYASAIHRRFVEPLAALLKAKYTSAPAKRGRTARITVLMQDLDPLVTAYLSARTVLNALVPAPDTKATAMAVSVGTTIYGETLLRTFEDMNPALFHTLTRDLKRRMSKSERHRINVFRHEARKAGIEFEEWTASDRAMVGTAILREMEELGLVERRVVSYKGQSTGLYNLTEHITELLENIKEFVSLTQPMTMPCVEKPRRWITANDGGWHTKEMRRTQPCVVTGASFVEDDDVPDSVLDTVNWMQSTEWQVNRQVLSAVHNIARHFDVGDVISQAEVPKPHKPLWLVEGMKKEDMNEDEQQEFLAWKRDVAAWYTEKRERGVKWGRFYESLRVANRLKDEERLYFIYQMDYRGRFYAKSRGITPQGSDLQKALLRFRNGGLIGKDEDSVRWFKINGANRFGFDAAELDDRVKWVDERHEYIIQMAQDPISYRDWTEADNPFQFLAWCFEYADWIAFPDIAKSHLAVGLDGSCNGLQHFSAMTRDEVGGEATNLLPGQRRDIYEKVALRLTEIIREEDPEEKWREPWLKHGINRSLTKKTCMTLPYGSTRFSCVDFIQSDYLRLGKAPEFAKDAYMPAANWLSHRMWAAIGDVVVKGQEAMAWLQQAAQLIVEQGEDEITWLTPNGMRVRQRYSRAERLRLVSRLHGSTQITLNLKSYDGDKVDGRKHMLGISPNFVHSLDAAHMQRVISACAGRGIESLAMIHDDYGTTPDRTQELYSAIRETFVTMYTQHSPLQELSDKYELPVPPEDGLLEITDVLRSEHFFS